MTDPALQYYSTVVSVLLFLRQTAMAAYSRRFAKWMQSTAMLWCETHRTFSTVCSSTRQRIGFIGLGNMGSHMATNLQRAGHLLTVHDRNDAAVRALVESGAAVAQSPREVAELTDVVITMLPSSEHVLDVYTGRDGVLQSASPVRPSLLIDCSTIEPKVSRQLADKVQACKLANSSRDIGGGGCPVILDAPVSGGVMGAQAATLSFMVGGPESGLEAATPLLLAMGKRIIPCGNCGNGAAAKVCNNMALAVSMAGISEALVLGQKLGIDAHTLSDVFNCSSARCWSSDTCNPVPGVMAGVPASRDYEGGFACQLMAKDLKLVVRAAAEFHDAKIPLAATVYEMYLDLCKNGRAAKDFSSIFQFFYQGKAEFFSEDKTSGPGDK